MSEPDEATPRRRPTGRRAGDSGTREAILTAARTLFADGGLDGTSLRSVATAAGVDPALVRHFFTDKETLFATVMADREEIPRRIGQALAGDPATLGRRVADAYLRLWDDEATRPVLFGLVRSATTSDTAADLLLQALSARIRLPGPDGDHPVTEAPGAALAAAQLMGVAVARYMLRVPSLAELDHDTLVDHLAPALQQLLTGPSHTSPTKEQS